MSITPMLGSSVTNEKIAAELAVHSELLKHIAAEVKETKEQARATNGRVTALEKWTERAKGAWFVLSIAGPVITGLILKFV